MTRELASKIDKHIDNRIEGVQELLVGRIRTKAVATRRLASVGAGWLALA